MMKKHNEGYVLAMVMCVIAVLAVVASAMLGVGLRNVQTQQAAVKRMQAKYEAEGQLEIGFAVLETLEAQTFTGEIQETVVKNSIDGCLKTSDNVVFLPKKWDWKNINSSVTEQIKKYKFEYTVTLQAKNTLEAGETEIAEVNCQIYLAGIVANVEDRPTEYTIAIDSLTINSYEVGIRG